MNVVVLMEDSGVLLNNVLLRMLVNDGVWWKSLVFYEGRWFLMES